MIQVDEKLWIGNQSDFEQDIEGKLDLTWAIVHAAKEPYHRMLLGYTTPGAPKDHEEYYLARRGDTIYLNLIDAPKVEFIPEQIIKAAIEFIDEEIKAGKTVFVHCNQGESRAPSIALLYLYIRGDFFEETDPELVIEEFIKIYPGYNPGQGMLDLVVNKIQSINIERG